MHIDASAPTRIDLAGGTLDIWPLYLFHDGAQTLNAAISLRARCDDHAAERSAAGHRLGGHRAARRSRSLVAPARQPRPAAARPPAAPLPGRGARAAHAVGVAGRRRHRRLLGAEHRGLRRAERVDRRPPDRRRDLPDRDERRGAGDRRADRRAGLPAGLYGGISAVELGVDGVRRVALECPGRRARAAAGAGLHQRLPQLGHQQLGRHQAAHRRRPSACSAASRASATSPPRCATRSSGATGPKSAGRSPPNGRTASARAGRHDAGDRRDAGGGAGGRRDRREGLRRRRRRLPVLLRRARRRSPPFGRRSHDAGARVLDFTIEERGLEVLAVTYRPVWCLRLCAPGMNRRPSTASTFNRSVDNLAIARVLAEIGDLLEIKGENPFKIRAYRNAAETVVHETRRVAGLSAGRAPRAPGHRQGPRRQDRRARRDRRDRLPPGSAAGVPADDPRSAPPPGRRAQDGRPPLPRARRSARSTISKQAATSGPPARDQRAWARRRKR